MINLVWIMSLNIIYQSLMNFHLVVKSHILVMLLDKGFFLYNVLCFLEGGGGGGVFCVFLTELICK